MATTVTPTQMVLNAGTAFSPTAATANTADLAETFTFTPSKPDDKCLIIIDNVATDQGAITAEVSAGGFYAGKAISSISVAQGTKEGIVFESAAVKAAAGTISLVLTPASGKRLLTDHTATVEVIQLP